MKRFKIAELKPLLFIGTLVLTNTSSAQLDLRLDTDTPSVKNTAVPILDAALYDINSNVITIATEKPVLCTHILGYEPISNLEVKVYDSNFIDYPYSDLRDFNLGVVDDLNYDLNNRSINILSENRNKAKCIAYDTDLIYRGGFANEVVSVDGMGTMKYVNTTNSQFPDAALPDEVYGELVNLDYEVQYTNTTNVQQVVDYLDFWPQEVVDLNPNDGIEPKEQVYFQKNSSDPWFQCNNSDTGIYCGNFNKLRIGEIKRAFVNPGRTLKISYDKTLIVPSSLADGGPVYMMAGLFLRGESSEGPSSSSTRGGGEIYRKHIVIQKQIDVIVE